MSLTVLVVAYVIERLFGGTWIRIVGNSDGSRRHDRRYRMLIDHLTDTVPQQYYKGIKRLYLALQLNPVNKVHRNRNSFFPQYIEERVLQCCPSLLWHVISPLLIYLLFRQNIQIIAGLPGFSTRYPGNIVHNLASKQLAENCQALTEHLTI